MMKTHLKKILAVTLSAAMLLSSFSVFAENDTLLSSNVDVLEDVSITEEISSEENPASAEVTELEEIDTTDIPDMTVWSVPTMLDLNSSFIAPMSASAEEIASGKCGDNLTWTLDGDGTLTISGTGNMYNYLYTNAGTTSAAWGKYADSLKKLILSKGVTSIGNYAFYKCSGLTGDLVIPDSVTSIGINAFKDCSGFDGNLIIPDSVTSIGNIAFSNCSGLTGELVIPDSVTSIGMHVFYNCSGLTGDLVIPDSVTSIDNYAFYNCSGFDGNLIIPDSITSIGSCAFYNCSGLTGDLVIPDSITSISSDTFAGCSGFDGNLIIADSVTSIGVNAFYKCSGLTGDLVIPDSVTSIGNCAFYNCSGLTGDLVIPDSVTSIGTSAFSGCIGFDGNLIIADSVTSIGTSVFSNCSGLTGNLVIPAGITSIESGMFYKCSGLTGNLVIPDGITSIGMNAFTDCNGLTGNLIIPDSVTNIDTSVFSGCRKLSDMYIPKSEDSMSTGNFPNRVHWKYDLSKCTASINDQVCTGNAIIPNEESITVTSPNGKTLYYGLDYVIESASNNVKVGTATAHIAPPSGGISILSQDVPFNIVGIDLSGATVTFPDNITYQGEPCKPEPTVVVNGKTLVKDTDYSISYSDNNGEGTGKAVITGIGDYIGSVNTEFEIKPFKPIGYGDVDISKDVVEATIDGTFVYDGTAKEPKPVLVYHFTNPTTGITIDYDMVEGTDYEIVSYKNNVNAGTAIITIAGIGTFESKRIINFNISPCELSATKIADIPSAEYCKADICPEPEIKIGDVVLTKDVDYTLEYENNLNRGIASVIIKGKGNLSGTVTKNFEITPRDGTKFTIIIWL